jgi:hypothetical protein
MSEYNENRNWKLPIGVKISFNRMELLSKRKKIFMGIVTATDFFLFIFILDSKNVPRLLFLEWVKCVKEWVCLRTINSWEEHVLLF